MREEVAANRDQDQSHQRKNGEIIGQTKDRRIGKSAPQGINAVWKRVEPSNE